MQSEQEKRYIEAIKDISSIQFVSFAKQPDWIHEIFQSPHNLEKKIAIMNRNGKSLTEESSWIASVLQGQNIAGDFLLSFSWAAFNIPYAHVTLARDYSWIEPIWQLGHQINLIPLGNAYLLRVRWTESCIGGNCIVVRLAERP